MTLVLLPAVALVDDLPSDAETLPSDAETVSEASYDTVIGPLTDTEASVTDEADGQDNDAEEQLGIERGTACGPIESNSESVGCRRHTHHR